MLEGDALVNGQRVGLGNDGNNVDNLGQLLEDNNVNGLQSNMTGRYFPTLDVTK